MATPSPYRVAILISLGTLLFAALHLAYEHLDGGVRGHHVLNRADLPLISNWLGLAVLPLLGWLLGIRIRNQQASSIAGPGERKRILVGFGSALIYGAALATAFELDLSAAASGLFLGLFLLAAALPVYRAECVLGFVMGMTFTFGAVLPALVAAVFASLSFLLRFVFRWAASKLRQPL